MPGGRDGPLDRRSLARPAVTVTDSDPFAPDPGRAAAIDAGLRATLLDSLEWVGESFPVLAGARERGRDWRARPVDFGFYFDLAAAIHHATIDDDRSRFEAEADALARSLARSLGRASETGAVESDDVPIPLRPLGPPHYDALERDCMVRWLDLEPDNAMALAVPSSDATHRAGEAIGRARALLRATAAPFAAEMDAITTELVLAEPGPGARLAFGGASSFALWGALAVNPAAHESWWDYLPRLVHEYSHNLLFGLAADGPLVENDPDERHPSPLREEPRPIDGIFHALYVSAREVAAMDAMLAAPPEAWDRACGADAGTVRAFCRRTARTSLGAYRDCRSVIDRHARPTALGRRVLDGAAAAMEARAAS